MWPWETQFNSPSLTFPICKMKRAGLDEPHLHTHPQCHSRWARTSEKPLRTRICVQTVLNIPQSTSRNAPHVSPPLAFNAFHGDDNWLPKNEWWTSRTQSELRLGRRGHASAWLRKLVPTHTVMSTLPQGQPSSLTLSPTSCCPGSSPPPPRASAQGAYQECTPPPSRTPPPGGSGFQGPQEPTLGQVAVDANFPNPFLNLLSVSRAFLVSLAGNRAASPRGGDCRQIRCPFPFLQCM